MGQQRLGGQNHGRRGIARLDGPGADERFLDGVQGQPLGQILDRFDGVAIGLGGQQDVGRHQAAIQQHGGGPGLAGFAAVTHAVQSFAPQQVQQAFAGIAGQGTGLAVEDNMDVHGDLLGSG